MEDVAVGHWAVGFTERICLVLDAQHRQVLLPTVLQGTRAVGRKTDDGSFADREDFAVNLVLAFTLDDDVKIFVRLVGVEEAAVLTGNQPGS